MTDLPAIVHHTPTSPPSTAPLGRPLSRRSFSRASGWMRGVLACVALTVSAALPVRAQSVVGYGDDATTMPGGMVRIGMLDTWSRWFQEYDAATGAAIQTRSQQRITPFTIDLGITDRLMLSATVATVGTKEIATYFPDTARDIHADSLRTFNRSGLGDAAATLKYVWLGHESERDRIAARGLHVRSALTASAVVGTGAPARAFDQFGLATGEGESGIEAGSFWDVRAGHTFWTTVALRYEHHMQDTRSLRVGGGAPGDPFDPTATPLTVTRRLGDAYSLDVTPRFSLGEYFSVGARYQYEHEKAGVFSGTLNVVDSAGDVTHLDAASLGPGSAFTNQWVGVGVVYSSVAASETGRGNFPFELTLQYRRSVSLSGGRPERGEWAAGLRFYQKLWGRGVAGRDAPNANQRRPDEP